MKKVVIAGGSGFVGRAVVDVFAEAGYDVVVLSRSGKPGGGSRVVKWDGKGPGNWYDEVNGADVVVNLCGESVLKPWTPANMASIRESRIGPTCLIGAAIAASSQPAKAWLNVSAVGWYGNTGVREISEASPAANDFLARLCQDWEAEVDKADTPQTRKVKVRIGVAMGYDGDFFKQLSRLTKMFLGGPLGKGQQYVPWIHVQDVARMFLWAAEGEANGPLNATSPHPVTNATLMAAFRSAYSRPPAPPVPEALVLQVCKFMKWDPNLLLGGTRAIPAIALARGFEFDFPDLESAMRDLVDEVPDAWKPPMADAPVAH